MINTNTKQLKFPENFLWGASTSAHQIEGGLCNDWSEWEKSESRIKNYESRGLDLNDYISGQACDSFNRFEDDLECLKYLNCNAYRFSIDWSRVEPGPGKFDDRAIEYYTYLAKKLKENNIEPFVTLWHWPLPLWVRDMGGWTNKQTIELFNRFAEKMVGVLRGDVKYWITLNEPYIYSLDSYLRGLWPPQKRNPFSYFKVNKNLTEAHNRVYDTIKKTALESYVGIANNLSYFEAKDNKFVNKVIKKILDKHWNYNLFNKIKNKLDFIGLNYYFHNRIDYGLNKNENKIINDLGWELYPSGIYNLLLELKKYNKPIYITEHGLADEHDKQRAWYISESLKYISAAMQDSADVRGYFHWSLLDNFEWAHGFGPKFGLYSIDRKTFDRKPRPSVEAYKKICQTNSIEI